jgi:hypothetical protein
MNDKAAAATTGPNDPNHLPHSFPNAACRVWVPNTRISKERLHFLQKYLHFESVTDVSVRFYQAPCLQKSLLTGMTRRFKPAGQRQAGRRADEFLRCRVVELC